MRPVASTPEPATRALLPGAIFADTFSIEIDEAGLDAVIAAKRVMGGSPHWIRSLLSLRDAIVGRLGLKRSSETGQIARDRIGVFPCLSRSADLVVLGLDDRHLDFRIAVDVRAIASDRKRISVTTIVRPHNLFGRAYLACVLPFHKIIVPAMLRRVRSA